MRSPIEFMCGGHGSKPKKKMMTAGTAVFACYSAACAPPSAGGTGGSIAGKGPKGGAGGGSRGSSDRNPPANLYARLRGAKPKSADAALDDIRKDKPVKVASVKEAGTVVKKLGELVNAAKAKGQDAGRINLCQVSVPGTNLFCGASRDIPREKMPQFSGKPVPGSEADKLPKNKNGEIDGVGAFIEHLKGQGVGMKEQKVKASELKASQAELVGEKVAGMMNNKDFDPAGEPIFVSKDGYVIDGHHRWAAQVARDVQDGRLGDLPLNVRVVDLTIDQALKFANKWATEFGIAAKKG